MNHKELILPFPDEPFKGIEVHVYMDYMPANCGGMILNNFYTNTRQPTLGEWYTPEREELLYDVLWEMLMSEGYGETPYILATDRKDRETFSHFSLARFCLAKGFKRIDEFRNHYSGNDIVVYGRKSTK